MGRENSFFISFKDRIHIIFHRCGFGFKKPTAPMFGWRICFLFFEIRRVKLRMDKDRKFMLYG